MVTRAKRASEERLIKKYPNRRLYDTQTSTYVTLVDIKGLVMSGDPFKVIDAKTEDDLTRNILLQIILEEEAGGVPVFSTHLEQSKDLFIKMQEQMQSSQSLFGSFPFAPVQKNPEKE